jgi:hypothetical protein
MPRLIIAMPQGKAPHTVPLKGPAKPLMCLLSQL